MDIEVAADVAASDAELSALDEAFARAGLEVHSEATYEMSSEGPLPWVVSVVIPVPLPRFFEALGVEAAKRLIQNVLDARADNDAPSGAAVLRDPDATNVVLASDLTNEALDALFELDWLQVGGDYLIWDEATLDWRDPVRRARRA